MHLFVCIGFWLALLLSILFSIITAVVYSMMSREDNEENKSYNSTIKTITLVFDSLAFIYLMGSCIATYVTSKGPDDCRNKRDEEEKEKKKLA